MLGDRMANFYKDNDDLRYYVERGIDWEPLVRLTEYLYRNEDGFSNAQDAVIFYREVLELVGEFAAEEVAPHSAEIDRQGVELVGGEVVFPKRLAGIFKKLKGLELYGLCAPRELGGMNCPFVVYLVTNELLSRADVSVSSHYGFHGGIAMAMLVLSIMEGTTEYDIETARITKTRWADAIAEILAGKAWGCMDITEPDAGSDMARLRAVGEQDADGNWTVTGSKIFITSGHGKYHFVIARTEKAPSGDDAFAGLGGLSMFLVPTVAPGPDGAPQRVVQIDRVEEKIGHHGSATCSLVFDRAPAELVGKRGEGFQYMLMLMNNARLAVGVEAVGLCESALRASRAYAAERRSMGKTIDRHEMIADYLDEMEVDILGLRALGMYGAWHEEMATKTRLLLDTGVLSGTLEEERHRRDLKHYKAVSRRVTPLLKYLAAEKAVEAARRAIQIHGGNGYTRDYPAEKLLRDALVLPIYEGTSQIQALMCMKDTLGAVLKNPQRFVKQMARARWRAMSSRDPLERRVAALQGVGHSAVQHLITRTVTDKYRALQGRPIAEWPQRFLKDWDPKRDFSFAMLHAERLTHLLARVVIAEVLLEQVRRHPERAPILERWLERSEPLARYLLLQIGTGDRLLAELTGSEDAAEARRAG